MLRKEGEFGLKKREMREVDRGTIRDTIISVEYVTPENTLYTTITTASTGTRSRNTSAGREFPETHLKGKCIECKNERGRQEGKETGSRCSFTK